MSMDIDANADVNAGSEAGEDIGTDTDADIGTDAGTKVAADVGEDGGADIGTNINTDADTSDSANSDAEPAVGSIPSADIPDAPPALVTADGRFSLGRFASPFRKVNPLDAQTTGIPRIFRNFRLKEWQHFALVSPTHYLSLALFNAKCLALAQVCIQDVAGKAIYFYEKMLPPWAFRVPCDLSNAAFGISCKGFLVRFENQLALGRHRIQFALDAVPGKGLPAVSGEFTLADDFRRFRPMEVCLPLPNGGALYSHKSICPLSGGMCLDGKEILFPTSSSYGLTDIHKGYYPYVMTWHWATAGKVLPPAAAPSASSVLESPSSASVLTSPAAQTSTPAPDSIPDSDSISNSIPASAPSCPPFFQTSSPASFQASSPASENPRSAGRLAGFNLTNNQVKDQNRYNENCLWLDGALYSLPPVAFEFDPDDIMSPWYIRDSAGRGIVDLTFQPEVLRRVDIQALVMANRYRGPYGLFSGRIRIPAGGCITSESGNGESVGCDNVGCGVDLQIDGFRGMCEDFRLRC